MKKYEALVREYQPELIVIEDLWEEYEGLVLEEKYAQAEAVYRKWAEKVQELQEDIEAEYVGVRAKSVRERGIERFWEVAQVRKEIS